MKTLLLIGIICLTICNCSNKTSNSSDTYPKFEQEYTTYNIIFSFLSDSILMAPSKTTLDSLYELLVSQPKIKMNIGVHSDFRGDDQLNLQLTQKRATSLKQYFVMKGINTERIKALGYGETKPLRPLKKQKEADVENINKRVTITFIK